MKYHWKLGLLLHLTKYNKLSCDKFDVTVFKNQLTTNLLHSLKWSIKVYHPHIFSQKYNLTYVNFPFNMALGNYLSNLAHTYFLSFLQKVFIYEH